MNNCVIQYYRCPERYVRLALRGLLSETSGYFRFGEEVCYGKYCGRNPCDVPTGELFDAFRDTTIENGTTCIPFDLKQVVDSLRNELYVSVNGNGDTAIDSTLARMYYFFRPLLPNAVRKHLKKVHLRGWQEFPFPHWPVDRTVDDVFERVLLLLLKSQAVDRIPFIWFWPDGASSCAVMTHDVETASGMDSCASLMDLNDSFGIKASFQIVPESRYDVTSVFLASIWERGFEVAVHDLNHDGLLFRDREQFLERVVKINSYGEQFGASGFRAAVLYRNQMWYDALKFSYDMSVPNVAHLDPQHGGCCTIMPYFIGQVLELPVTTTQDYFLFHILNDYSIDLWKQQTNLIMEKHGLISFIVHPDYTTAPRERQVYEALLNHLALLREEKGVWIPTPGEANRWWRQRAEMKIVEDGKNVRIEGPGRERGRIAYASEKDGRLVFTLDETPSAN